MVLRSWRPYFGHSVDHQVSQLAPVLRVGIHEEADVWVGFDIAHPLELRRGDSLGLAVERDVETLAVEGEADRHNMWSPLSVSSRQVGHSLGCDILQRTGLQQMKGFH